MHFRRYVFRDGEPVVDLVEHNLVAFEMDAVCLSELHEIVVEDEESVKGVRLEVHDRHYLVRRADDVLLERVERARGVHYAEFESHPGKLLRQLDDYLGLGRRVFFFVHPEVGLRSYHRDDRQVLYLRRLHDVRHRLLSVKNVGYVEVSLFYQRARRVSLKVEVEEHCFVRFRKLCRKSERKAGFSDPALR